MLSHAGRYASNVRHTDVRVTMRGRRDADPDRSLRQLLLAVVIVAIVAFLFGIALGDQAFGPDEPEPLPEPVTFTAESTLHDDRIVHTFTPDEDDHRDYRVTYRVFQDGTQIESVDDRPEELAADDPLVVEIPDRTPGAEYRIDVRIYDEFDRLVFDARIVISGQELDDT